MRRRKRYYNLDSVSNLKNFRDFLKWRKEKIAKVKDYSFRIPHAPDPDIAYLQTNRTETSITWIGHSTFFIQMDGLNIMTDPVWAQRMGFGKRLTAPGIPIEDLPEIDVVLISHGHYDHLHFPSLRKLKGNPLHLVPEGLAALFLKKGFSRVMELSWWQQAAVGDIEFTFVPAMHWTKRTLLDTNTSHWGGFVAKGRKTIYFVGDTAYFNGFKSLPERFAIDFVLMPIGAYDPEWFMSKLHVSPEDAVAAYLDSGAQTFIPMHYGTFPLADDTPKEALDRLHAEWGRRELDPAKLRVLALGQTLHLS